MHTLFKHHGVNLVFVSSTSSTDCFLDPVLILRGQRVCAHQRTSVHPDSCLLWSLCLIVCVLFLHVLLHSLHDSNLARVLRADVDQTADMQIKYTEFLLSHCMYRLNARDRTHRH